MLTSGGSCVDPHTTRPPGAAYRTPVALEDTMTIHDTEKTKQAARERLRLALASQAWQWLMDEDEELAGSVADCVTAGYAPGDVYRMIVNDAGLNRDGLAKRAELAAVHLAREGAS